MRNGGAAHKNQKRRRVEIMAMLESSIQVTSHLSMALIPVFEYWLLRER